MKVISVTQSCLKRSNFLNSRNLKLELNPQTTLEISAHPKLPHPLAFNKESLGLRGGLLGWLLPEGYPYSVHGNYLRFTWWTNLQGITSSFIGVLSTQAMLGSLMTISSSEISASDSIVTNGAASAAINWILKDGLGQAGGIALVTLLGSRLDSQARFLRFHATILFLLGSLLEFSIPFATPLFTYLSSPQSTFLILASTANILKNVSWMITSATRAHFMKHLALRGNLGDLTGKAASQMTLASLIGTGLGLLLLKYNQNNQFYFIATWLLNALVGIYSTHRACRVAISKQLNPHRIFNLIQNFSIHRSDRQKSSISRYFWTPEIFASREKFIWPSAKHFKIHFNEPLTFIQKQKYDDWIVPMDQLEVKKFSIARSGNSFYIWTLESASSTDKLSSIITAAIEYYKVTDVDSESVFEALRRQGWDVEHFSCRALDDKDKWIRIQKDDNDKED